METNPVIEGEINFDSFKNFSRLIILDSPKNTAALLKMRMYFRKVLGQLFLDKLASTFLLEQNDLYLSVKGETSYAKKIIEGISQSIEYKIFRFYTRLGFFVMEDSLFGSLFALYESFPSENDKVHATALVFFGLSNFSLVNRNAVILKKRCLVVHEAKDGQLVEFEIERCRKAD